MKTLAKLNLATFLVFFQLGARSWTQGINEGKAVAGITFIHGLIVMTILFWSRYLIGQLAGVMISPKALWIMWIVVGVANYYFLINRGYGTEYELEFRKPPTRSKMAVIATGAAVIVFCIAAAVTSALVLRPG